MRLGDRVRTSVNLLAAATVALLLALPPARAASLPQLVQDTQRTVQADGQLTFVWWMPQQFWEESLKNNPALTPEGRAQILAPLADYALFAVMRAKVGATGMTDVQPKAEVIRNLKLETNGRTLAPLPPESISPGAQLLLGQLKPALAAMAGQFGQNVEFVVFAAKDGDKTLVDAGQTGVLQLAFYDQTFRWRTPLGSLLPPRVDKKTGEEFPGNYGFNPYTGDKLTTK